MSELSSSTTGTSEHKAKLLSLNSLSHPTARSAVTLKGLPLKGPSQNDHLCRDTKHTTVKLRKQKKINLTMSIPL